MVSFDKLQSIGKALMLPVAVLPAAAVLLRLGASDVLDIGVIEKAGSAILDNLPTIFAIGIAFGLTRSKQNNGAAALAGFVCYTVFIASMHAVDPKIDMGVFAGILSGLTAAVLYNKFYKIQLPEFLGFFGGRRFVPIVSSFAAIVLAVIFSVVWPPVQNIIGFAGDTIIELGGMGTFVYGFLNRLLLPFGLHHILNNLIFFVVGSYTTPAGEVVHGDLTRFFAGDPTAGMFATGGFPVMMFGLPAVALAMYRTAKPENRPKIAGALVSMALTSFLTGVTEPLEFSFMFLAPVLYLVHAVLMGTSMFVCYNVGILIGCSFSMGFTDYVLNWSLATRPEFVIPIGIVIAVLYYVIFSQTIRCFDLPTLGRFDEDFSGEKSDVDTTTGIVKGLGGTDNLDEVDSCVTRLRITVKDASKVDEKFLKSLADVKGVMSKDTAVQIIMGFKAESVANDINSLKG